MLEANRHRPVTEQHPLHKLGRLVDEVKASIGEGGGGTAPLPAGYRTAVAYMADRAYLRTRQYADAGWQADTAGLDPDVSEFVRVFRRSLANIGVPAFADVSHLKMAYVLGQTTVLPCRSFSMAHCVRGRSLPKLSWSVLGHVGLEVAAKLGLKVRWGGHAAPWLWEVDG